MLNLLINIFIGFFVFAGVITLYAISGIKYMERMNQAREEKKNKL